MPCDLSKSTVAACHPFRSLHLGCFAQIGGTHVRHFLVPIFTRAPVWFVAASLGGIAWNIFGAVQFAVSVAGTEQSLIASGLTAEQAAVL